MITNGCQNPTVKHYQRTGNVYRLKLPERILFIHCKRKTIGYNGEGQMIQPNDVNNGTD